MRKAVITKTPEEFVKAVKEGNIPLWNNRKPLYELFESEYVQNSLGKREKLNLKSAYFQEFSQYIEVRDVSGKTLNRARDLEELINSLLEKGLSLSEVFYILSSNDKKELFEFIQNLIYLNVYPRAYTAREVAVRELIENLTSNIDNLLATFGKTIEEISALSWEEEEKNDHKERVLEFLTSLVGLLKKLKRRERVKVGVFATKKSGKSMVVNALLEEEFAPTSLELATPTVIEYHPWDKDFIKVQFQNGEEREFENSLQVKRYLIKEFKKVNLEGEKLPVVKIYYPRRKEGKVDFVIYDTPGPDLAASKHGEFIDEYINKSDVVVFVVDYSKYAQESEIQLLEKIAQEFKKQGKEQTLIIAVNKIDLMYQDTDTEKIRVRVADFIREKLKTLGIDSPIVIPITAMIYFYAKEIAKYYPQITQTDDVKNFFEELEEKILEEEDIPLEDEVIQTTSNFLRYLRTIHRIKKPTYEDLINATGFEGLKRYITYTGLEKALIQRQWFILNEILLKYTQLVNLLEIRKLLASEKLEKLKAYLEEIEQEVKKHSRELKQVERSLERKFYKFLGKLEEKLKERASVLTHELVDKIEVAVTTFMDQKHEEIENLVESIPKTTDSTAEVIALIEQIKGTLLEVKQRYPQRFKEAFNIVLERDIPSSLKSLISKEIEIIPNKLAQEVEREINRKTEEIKGFIEKLNAELHKRFNIEVDFKAPSLELPELEKLLIEELEKTTEKLQKELSAGCLAWVRLEGTYKIKKRSFWDKVFEWNWSEYRVYFYGKKDISEFFEKIHIAVSEKLEDTRREFQTAYENFIRNLIKNLEQNFEEKILKTLDVWKDTIEGLLYNIRQDLERDKKQQEKIKKFLEEAHRVITENLKVFQEYMSYYEKLK